ncbi:MAG: hypothetical protein ACWGOY_13105 [Anaerolineales bacterium]
MQRPFVDEDENYYPEAIIGFLALLMMGCIMGAVIAISLWALATGTVF